MLRFAVLTTSLVVALAGAALAADWDPNAWVNEDTINLLTVGPEEGPHEFPVWLVVIDGQVYVRLGSRAAERLQKNTTNPFIGVKIAGKEFAKIHVQDAPEMQERVAKAMSDKYASDFLVRFFSHPMTARLSPE